MDDTVAAFYDGLADSYRLVYGDEWEGAVERRSAALDRLIHAARPAARDLFDCSCGIGTQAIGLARRGYRVHGADLGALASMLRRLRPGGLLLVGIRDYDRAAAERPEVAPPQLVQGPPRRLVARLHDRDAPGDPHHTVRVFVLTETGERWTPDNHSVRYRAVTRTEPACAAEAAGFVDLAWIEPDASGLGEPLLSACA